MAKPSIAFYAPLKPPDHPIPSGDRQMARMLLAALNRAGYRAELASRYISYSKRHGAEYLQKRKQGAIEEAQRLLEGWEGSADAPDLWFCYHPYDKSPDWLGMEICSHLGIPMITAEPCKTGQGKDGEWLVWREEAQAGIVMANMNIVMTHSDKAYLESFVAPDKVTWMAPFIDAELLQSAEHLEDGTKAEELWQGGRKLLAVGMMRPGAKMDSYRLLAASLERLKEKAWSLVIVGGGPGDSDVARMFEWDTENRVNIIGEKNPDEVLWLMEQADILSWPGCREAYGMVYLEAASRGCVAVGLNNLGVPLVVADGVSGLLASPADVETYTHCLSTLIDDDELLQTLSSGAKRFVETERGGEAAAKTLRGIIDGVLEKHGT